MALSVTPFTHYTATASTHEDLTDLITNISPTDTPFLSRVQRGPKPASRTHLWPTDTLGSRTAVTPRIEGFAFTSDTMSGRTRLTNYVEILAEQVTVSDSMSWINQVGVKGEKAYQDMKAAKQLAIRTENRLWSTATGLSGSSSTAAPQIKAILAWITSEDVSATANRTLTTAFMNTALQGVWENGGDPELIYCTGPRQVNLVNLISSNYGSRQLPSSGGRVEQMVVVYQGDYGTQTVVKSRDIDANTYALIEMGRWAICWAVPPHRVDIAKDGYRSSSMIVEEYTLEARAESANAQISQMSG